MLYGGYDHTMDKKGRIAVPSKFRGDMGDSFVICRDITGKPCICGYPLKKWEELVERISALPVSKSSELKHFIFDGAFSVELDQLGRILVPAVLREYASLESDAHIIGLNTNIEIWNREIWAKENEKYTPESIALLVEELGI